MATSIDKTKFSMQEASYFMTPATDAVSITASAACNACRAIWVGTAGDLKVKMAADFAGTGGQVVTFKGVPGGTLLPYSIVAVYSTDTTASDVVALY